MDGSRNGRIESDAAGRRDEPLVSHQVVKRQLFCAALVFGIVACVAFGPTLWSLFSDSDSLRAWVESAGPAGPLAMVAAVFAQVVVAVLPGEPIELAAGYLFGFWGGTGLCLAGALLGTMAVTAFVRTVGMGAVDLIFDRKKIEAVSWLKDSVRLEAVMFAVFLIPGTPKDALTYVAALTRCPWWRIALISTVGRVPSVVSSTLIAGLAADGRWVLVAMAAAITIACAVGGGALYAALRKRSTR